MKRALLAAALVALMGGSTEPVKLRYPDGRIVECGPYFKPHSEAAAMREAKCIDDHLAQGAERL